MLKLPHGEAQYSRNGDKLTMNTGTSTPDPRADEIRREAGANGRYWYGTLDEMLRQDSSAAMILADTSAHVLDCSRGYDPVEHPWRYLLTLKVTRATNYTVETVAQFSIFAVDIDHLKMILRVNGFDPENGGAWIA